MSLGKQAKTLSKPQVGLAMSLIARTRYPERNRVILLLSIRAGLRAKEIARVTWAMVIDADARVGDAIHLQDEASKGRSGRVIPMHSELRSALEQLQRHDNPKPDAFVV